MDIAQERIATLHDYGGPAPSAPVRETAVVVPLAEREHASLAAERTFEALAAVEPGTVIVPLRAGADRLASIRDWLESFDVDIELLWCGGDRMQTLLADHGLAGELGKGRDVWLALGLAAETAEYVVCHDADRLTYDAAHVPRLVSPLADGFEFTKGYYARVEDGRLYGRLFRLCFVPLVRALLDRQRAPILRYLDSFRYALAGEFGLSATAARTLSIERRFGLEVGTLGGAFDHAGFTGTAQVDLGRYEHDHRAVGGPSGLVDMARDVTAALFRVVEERGVTVEYDSLVADYRESAGALLRQYAADAALNGLAYDMAAERDQVQQYAEAVRPPPGADDRLPPWNDAPLSPSQVRTAAVADAEEI